LLARGYAKGDPELFDAERALFPKDAIAYIKASQSKKWQSLVELQGNAADATLLDALVKELTTKGALFVLRHGFKCFGKSFQMAAFEPATGMNPDAQAAYAQNILSITRVPLPAVRLLARR
jgi:type I restriction enzyme, R subunit